MSEQGVVISAILIGDDEIEITFRELTEQGRKSCEQRTRWIDTTDERDRVADIVDRVTSLLDIGLDYQRDEPVEYTRDAQGHLVVNEQDQEVTE